MEQRDIDRINVTLLDHYGRLENLQTWRIVWSEDQFEWRYGTYEDRTSEGIFLREVTERRKVPKYRQWAPEAWVLERLIVVPMDPDPDHPQVDTALSYEPIWVFNQDLPPEWVATKFMVDQIYKNMRQRDVGVKYKDPDSSPDEAAYNREERLKDIEESLFGNETETGDALAYKQGVGFTGPPKILASKEVVKEN